MFLDKSPRQTYIVGFIGSSLSKMGRKIRVELFLKDKETFNGHKGWN